MKVENTEKATAAVRVRRPERMLLPHVCDVPIPRRAGALPTGKWRWLLNARLTAGLSQTVLGAKVGVRQSQIGAWERGEEAPHARHMLPLALALGVPVETVGAEVAKYFSWKYHSAL